MEYKDYYKIIGVSRNASQEEIKKAYRKLARQYHPDVSKERNAETKFKEINEAYDVLKDPEKREMYNNLGRQWQTGDQFKQGFNHRSHADFGDLFEELFTQTHRQGGHNPFDNFDFNTDPFGQQRQSHTRKGRDQNTKISITLEEAYNGSQRSVHLDDRNRTRTLNVKIPAGVVEGQKIRLTGQGQLGLNGIRGDLYLEINVATHRFYELKEKDIYLNLPITPWEAALGTTVTVPTLGGKVELKIPVNSQSDQKLRLKGRGLGKPAGDQYVILKMTTPPAHNEAMRSFYRDMAKIMPFNPRQLFD